MGVGHYHLLSFSSCFAPLSFSEFPPLLLDVSGFFSVLLTYPLGTLTDCCEKTKDLAARGAAA